MVDEGTVSVDLQLEWIAQTSNPPTKPTMSRPIAAQISKLEKAFEFAKELSKLRDEGLSVAKIAKRRRLNLETIYKTLALVDKERGFSKKEQTQMYRWMKENQFPLCFVHLAKLSTVSDRKIRVALLKATIENQWSSRELQTQIISRLGRYRRIGRKLIIHSDPMANLQRKLFSTSRYIDAFREKIEHKSIRRDLAKLKGLVAVLEKKCLSSISKPTKPIKKSKKKSE